MGGLRRDVISRIKEIFKWRQLVFSLALKDLKTKYHQATGGFGWMLVTPLVQMVIFTFIFRFLFKVKIENYPLFLLSGLLPWSFLRSSLDASANSVLSNANLVKKTYFPREALPFSNIITNLISFFFSLIILFIFSLFYKISLFPAIFWLPLVIFLQIILITGISLLLAALNTIYRETQFIMDILLLAWFYVTPIVYPLGMIKGALPKGLFVLYRLNPMLGITSGYQQIFVYGRSPNLEFFLNTALVSISVFILGWLIFSRYEDVFVDMV